MKVALDTQSTVGTPTGIGVYADDLARALTAVGIEVARLRAPWLDPWRFDRRVAWDQALFPFFAARSRADVVHATVGTLPLVRTAPTVDRPRRRVAARPGPTCGVRALVLRVVHAPALPPR